MKNKLTVGELRRYLENFSLETEITFGSSKYRKRPLIFYRFKQRGENSLQIELNEIDQNFDPTAEIDCRKTVEYFLTNLANWSDETAIGFGSSLDAVPLEFRDVTNVVSINLEQNQEPQWFVDGDK